MLKPGGYLAMFMTRSDESSLNENLSHEIDQVYEKYFRVKQKSFLPGFNSHPIINFSNSSSQYRGLYWSKSSGILSKVFLKSIILFPHK